MTDDEKIQHYRSLNPTLFDVLDRFEVYQHYRSDSEHKEALLVLRLRMFLNEEDDLRRLRLSFSGVRNLKLDFQSLGLMYVSSIDIRSIRHYQWEKLNYEVEDAEQHAFSFVCRSFEASLEEATLEDEEGDM